MTINHNDTTQGQIQQWLDENPDPQSKGAVRFVKKLKEKLKNQQEQE
ncbi:MAG TPA: hypothetical protein V6D14_31655 [Coleofasciculaceae cyanobacterium]|jgi:hypothetical protein